MGSLRLAAERRTLAYCREVHSSLQSGILPQTHCVGPGRPDLVRSNVMKSPRVTFSVPRKHRTPSKWAERFEVSQRKRFSWRRSAQRPRQPEQEGSDGKKNEANTLIPRSAYCASHEAPDARRD